MNYQISFHRRLVLAAVLIAGSASSALADDPSNVQGSFSGYGVGAIEGGTLVASDSGWGTASQIGQFTFTMLQTVNLATSNGSGGFVLAFSNGDKLYGSLSGAADPSDPAHIVLSLAIAGGTGRFRDATGTLTFDRHSDFSTLPAFESNYGTVTGAISTPGPAK